MIDTKKARLLIDSWINGNRSDVRRALKNKSKCFILDLVVVYKEYANISWNDALHEVYNMCESK